MLGESRSAASKDKPKIGHARLELPMSQFRRLHAAARAVGLSVSQYVRDAVLTSIAADEAYRRSRRP